MEPQNPFSGWSTNQLRLWDSKRKPELSHHLSVLSQSSANSFMRAQLQCSIFSTTFNPNQQRLGNKILRQRLKGPTLAAYYPRRSATIEDILNEFKKFDLKGFNEDEEERLESVALAKLRGKGAPKKKRTAAGRILDILRFWRDADQVLQRAE